MAVPKKKISHSRGRKRRLELKRNTDFLYQKSSKTGHFRKLHSLCPISLHKNSGLKGLTLNSRFGTNIEQVYEF
jgi:ribosomal protein L32